MDIGIFLLQINEITMISGIVELCDRIKHPIGRIDCTMHCRSTKMQYIRSKTGELFKVRGHVWLLLILAIVLTYRNIMDILLVMSGIKWNPFSTHVVMDLNKRITYSCFIQIFRLIRKNIYYYSGNTPCILPWKSHGNWTWRNYWKHWKDVHNSTPSFFFRVLSLFVCRSIWLTYLS